MAGLAMPAAAQPPAGGWRAPGQMRVDKLGDSKWDNADSHDLREVETQGTMRALVLLVDFADVRFSVSSDPRQTIDDMLNSPGFAMHGAVGSARDFYTDASRGQFTPVFDVVGPLQLSRPEVDYVKSDEKYTDPDTGRETDVYPAGRMVEEAVRLADSTVDFTDYDANGDGMVDFVYIFFPGKGATTGGNVNTTIWPHAYTLTAAIGTTVTVDGVEVNRYATSSELGSTGKLSGIGTFCHEFAHVLGLPDLYDTANNGSASKCFTPGSFSIMDAGDYNNAEHTPALFSSYESYALEWAQPLTLNGGGHFTMLPWSQRPVAYKVPSPRNPQEYFLFECRARDGWDAGLEGEGLAVWHIDYDERLWNQNAPNNDPSRQRIDLVEADYVLTAASRSGDLFPGTGGVCEFVSNVSPSFMTWDNTATGYEIEAIERHPDGAVSFNVLAENGKTHPGAVIDAPVMRLAAVGTSEAAFTWEPVEGADEYVLSIWPSAGDPRRAEARFINAGDQLAAVANALMPDTEYSAVLYATNDVNASRQAAPVQFRTQGTAFASASTHLYPYFDNGEVRIDWDAVDGAADYVLEIAASRQAETAGVEDFGFEGAQLPEGFEGNGTFETRAAYCGADAPSFKMDGTDGWLQTPRYDEEISSVSFWCRQRFGNAEGRLDFYNVLADGALRNLGCITEFTTKGERTTFDLPADVHCLRMVWTQLATGLDFFADDLQIALSSPGSSLAPAIHTGAYTATSATVAGLDPNTQYTAWITPRDAQGKPGRVSEKLVFVPSKAPSAVEEVELPETNATSLFRINGGVLECADNSLHYDVYTVDGHCIALRQQGALALSMPGIYIVRTQGQAIKLISK